ncbi:hypothetical protein NTGHW29_740060 [Candidatus Nitrotoga sp. HW29]|nr:hypothetical protein NTGHW29_740060 [Candidatus Nitrotoga sp. HW29]
MTFAYTDNEVNYHLLKVGGLVQLECRRLKPSNRTQLSVHESMRLKSLP